LAEIYVLGGTAFASDGTSYFPDVEVTCRNITRGLKKTVFSDPSDGSYAFELFSFGGAATGDKVEIVGRIGSFYARATHTVTLTAIADDINLTLAAEDKIRVLNISRLIQELITFTRKNLSDPESRGTMKSETQKGDGSKVKFSLVESTIKFISSVRVNSAIQSEWADYFVDYKETESGSNAEVFFLTPPGDGIYVDFTYNYGLSWVYPDEPREDIKLTNYPRCSVSAFPISSRDGGLNGFFNFTSISINFTFWSKETSELFSLASDIRTIIMENQKNFHHFIFISPTTMGAPIPTPRRGERIIEITQGFNVPFKGEKTEN